MVWIVRPTARIIYSTKKKKYRMGKKKTPNKKGRKTKAALMREILYSGW